MNQPPNHNPNPHVPPTCRQGRPQGWDKPIQYQTGWVEFYKLKFKVTPDVLIPRPESELLVDEVIYQLADYPEKRSSDEGSNTLTILDIGTGSGCIAISIAVNTRNLRTPTSEVGPIIGLDISSKALRLARINAKLHKVEDKVTFAHSDLLSQHNELVFRGNSPIIIVANLPYIPTERIPYLDESVRDYEPIIALDGGKDGFELYRRLFKQIVAQPRRLHPKLIIHEIDYTHGELAYDEAKKYFPQAEVEVKKDLAKKQRILVIKL